jgi:hypothetical protein
LDDIDPELPFFCYYTPSGTHAPHHPTPEWMYLFRNLLCHIWLESGTANARAAILADEPG